MRAISPLSNFNQGEVDLRKKLYLSKNLAHWLISKITPDKILSKFCLYRKISITASSPLHMGVHTLHHHMMKNPWGYQNIFLIILEAFYVDLREREDWCVKFFFYFQKKLWGGVNKEIFSLDDVLKLLNLDTAKTHSYSIINARNILIEGKEEKFYNVILRNDDLRKIAKFFMKSFYAVRMFNFSSNKKKQLSG